MIKNIYLSALFLVLALGLNAQVGHVPLAPKSSTFESNKALAFDTRFEKAILWSNNVSNPGGWSFTNTSSPSQNWYVENDPAMVPSDGPVNFATATDGYLLINSDTAGQGAQQNAYATCIGSIDLTGEPNVTLEFAQHYRIYQDERYVDVSNNGGITWTTFTITDGTEPGGTVVSGVESLDISTVAGNQSNVTIRFHYIGEWSWHWAVDDIVVKRTEPFDLRADGTAWGVSGAWGYRLPYYSTPTTQIQPIEFCGISSNIGVNDIADATYSVEIPTFLSTSGTINSLAGSTDTICAIDSFTPPGVGSYTASASMSTISPDTGPDNNDFSDVTFTVDPFIYARDNSMSVIDGALYNEGFGFETGNIFDIFNDVDLHSIRVGIDSAAVVGSNVYVKLYSIDSMMQLDLQDQSFVYSLTTGDLGSFIDLALVSGANSLIAGESYLVIVGSDGVNGVTDDLVVATSGFSEPGTSFFFSMPLNAWTHTTATPVVQMNFEPIQIGIIENENIFELVVYPNPAKTDATIGFSLDSPADVSISITDLSGKVVFTEIVGNVSSGTTEFSIDTESLSNGVYMIHLVAGNAISTEKLIIRK